ncbi:MAG TPA: YihY/virulence factor BrkB family protein [Actinomycetota bacterium]
MASSTRSRPTTHAGSHGRPSKTRRTARRASATTQRWVDRAIGRLPRFPRHVVERARGQDIALFASGLAFYALVSAAPLAVVAVWVASVVVGDARMHELATQLQQHAPGGIRVGSTLQSIVAAGTSIGVVALITALWPASSYGAGLRRAFVRLSPRNPREAKGLRGRGLALLVLLPVLVAGSLLGSFVGTNLLGDGGVAYAFGIVMALAIGFLAAAVGVALIYRIFPPERMRWRSILKGTLFAAAAVSVLSLGMTLFVGAAGSSEREHFGSTGIALMVLFAVWLFLSNVMLLIGYVIAQEE